MAYSAPPRVVATETATQLIDTLTRRYGPLMFFQSGGCCDGSSPMCYAAGDFNISQTDVLLGTLHGAPFYIGRDQFEYWQHTQLIIDVVDGMGGMFSLENGTGKRFFTRSRLFTDEECDKLARQAARECVRQAAPDIRA
ncbi:DUF779 domain-containing protein [Noviherbaspirillum aerium]|uniref:DUF779 domain-containing protein n=1 Tax=Noviherbaspirillum aerium TaxID=2588497 RepID=UPI00124EEBEB|nr:DUF779 domain-containing protein [Noviherbaspirillum aerium]